MSDRNIVDYNGLQTYDTKIKEYITDNGDSRYARRSHEHYLSDIGFDNAHGTIPKSYVPRLAGFRNCNMLNPNVAGTNRVVIETDEYDMAYINIDSAVTKLIIKLGINNGIVLDNETVKSESKARCIKIILVNAGDTTIEWEDNVIWMDGDNEDGVQTFTAKNTDTGADGIDIVDLVTVGPDDSTTPATPAVWFGSISKNYH